MQNAGRLNFDFNTTVVAENCDRKNTIGEKSTKIDEKSRDNVPQLNLSRFIAETHFGVAKNLHCLISLINEQQIVNKR